MTNNINKYKEDIEWDLNLLFQYDTVWPTIYNTLRSYNFTTPKANLFGTPSNIWAGGQIPGIYGEFKKETLKNLYAYLQQNLTNPILNFSNTNLTKEDLKDEYANFILETSFEYNARFIVYSDYLRDYIKEKNPDATVVASVIKANCRFQGPNKIEEATIENETNYYNKLLKEYDIVVVRPEYSKDILPYHPEYIDDISRLEVLINQPCIKNCPKMPEHYKCTEKLNTNLNQEVNFECIKNNIHINEIKLSKMELLKEVKENKFIVLCVESSVFNNRNMNGGHFIVLNGINNNKIRIINPIKNKYEYIIINVIIDIMEE